MCLNYPLSDPIENPCTDIPVFETSEIELLEEVSKNVWKVKARNMLRCLKIAPGEELLQEITSLIRMPKHPNIPSPLVGVVSAGQGKIDQLIIPWIVGVELRSLKSCALERKTAWKAQISEAIGLLHDNGMAWGDGHAGNVMIEACTDRAVLIDFGSAFCKGCGEDCVNMFFAKKKWDIEVLRRLTEFIDELEATK